MKSSSQMYDVAVIGGGLSGLCAALRLGQNGVKTILLNTTINSSDRALGGFARFSGAKFSLPPAGMGLLPIVGSSSALFRIIEEVISILGIKHKHPEHSIDLGLNLEDRELSDGVLLRNYNSIVLTPSEMNEVIDALAARVCIHSHVIDAKCISLTRSAMHWHSRYLIGDNIEEIVSNAVFFAGGRIGSEILRAAGCQETHGKGLDLGIRVEFPNKNNLLALRKFGPDAKVLSNNCRTFCLNVPGTIYRYPLGSIEIPGGIVASHSEPAGNVGLLFRTPDKVETLRAILFRAQKFLNNTNRAIFVTGDFLGEAEKLLNSLYGTDVVSILNSFGATLHTQNLIDWNKPHIVHIPLLDWHWPTFSQPNTFSSSCADLVVLGDSSGHARGLLQAAISGYIAALEYTS